MRGDVHAVHPDRSGSHKADRRCPCGPTVMRALDTGRLTVWVHKSPPIYHVPPKEPPS